MLNTSVESTSSHRSLSPSLNELLDTFGAEISKLNEQRQTLYKARLARRRQNETTDKIELECDSHDLLDTALNKFAELVDRADVSSIYCFKVILNSLYAFYSTQSHCCSLPSCPSCKESVEKFLNTAYLEEFAKTCIPPNATKNGKAEQAYRQRELLALLGLHKFRHFPQPIEKLNVSSYLQFLYFHAGSDRLRTFLDTTFTDEFFIDLPFYLAAIYDTLGFICPDDIEECRPQEEESTAIFYEDRTTKADDWGSRLDDFINSLNVDDDEDRQTEIAGSIASTSKEQTAPARTLRALKSFYPETPVKKPRNADENLANEGIKIVKQTPISKIKRNSATSMDRNVEYWSNIGTQDSKTTTVPLQNRKRPNNFAQDSMSTKKQRAVDGSYFYNNRQNWLESWTFSLMTFCGKINECIRFQLVCLGLILSLFIIQEGLLLKKHSIEQKSQCFDVNAGQNCWIEPTYSRAVIILVDALRFDFVNPDIKDNKIYHGAMPRIGNYLNNHKENARLYKFIADAPTTTMQRINGLITGNIPAFIDASENFAATEIHEDNLLSQLNTQNRSTVLLGDDTWIKLLPNTFTRTFEMDSFDVKDLDTVDSTIKPKLFEELKTNNFTLLISHFLGVDHCGHRYGPNHPEMRRKLNEMDQIVAEVVESLDDKTVLFVFGDHGMTEGGDHGGDANLEVEAALFVYSKKPLPRSNSDAYSTVSQIDLLPTISLLLDSPIPFSNLGAIIEDLFEQTKVGIAREMNVMQVIRYVSTYKIENPTVQRSIKHAIQNYESQLETDSSTIDKEIIHELRRLIIGTINNFDMSLIYIGLASFTEALLSVCVLLSGYKTSLLVFIIFRTGVLFLQYAIYLGGMAREDNSILTYMAIYLSIAYSAVVVLDRLIYSRWTKDLFELAPTLLPVLLCVGLFSNSFIIYGAMTSRFLLTSIMVIEGIRLLLERPRFSEKKVYWKQIKGTDLLNFAAFIAVLLLIRLSVYFNRCREEQVDCFESMFAIPTGLIVEGNWRLFRLLVGILCTVGAFKLFQQTSNLNQSTARIGFSLSWLALLGVFFNWACESSGVNFYRQAGIYSAQLVFLICFIIIGSSFVMCSSFCEFGQALRLTLFLVLLLLLGDGSSISFALAFVANIVWREYSGQFGDLTNGIFYFLLSNHLFYSLGHHATFASIPWTAAFVGLPSMANKVLPAAFVLLHIYSGIVFCSIESVLSGSNLRTMHTFLTLEGLKTFFAFLSGVVQRRHLMFFKIFAPNFLFHAVGLVILAILVMLMHLFHLIKSK